MRKKRKKYDDDGGYTIIDMNVEGMPGYINPEHKKNMENIKKLQLSKKEKRAIFWGSFLAMLPVALIIIAAISLVFLFAYLWLG